MAGVLNLHFLFSGRSDHSLELNLLHVLLRLLDALADQVDENRVGLKNVALDLHEADVIVDHVRVECHVKLQVVVRR